MLAVLDGKWLRGGRPWSEIFSRGLAAAVLGGIAFYLVVGILWDHDRELNKNYLVQYSAWVFAWAPGILALTIGMVASTPKDTPAQRPTSE